MKVRRRVKTRGPRFNPDDVVALKGSVHALASRIRCTAPALRAYDQDDLVQEAILKAITKLPKFKGRSSLKTWVITLARNHLLSMANKAALRTRGNSELLDTATSRDHDPLEIAELKGSTKRLLGWLRQNPHEVPYGLEVFNLLLWNHANYAYVALAMSIHTGSPWTPEKVRATVAKIRETERGQALCGALGIGNRRRGEHRQ